jgi:tetratricopeptide (TPR) repeat protein
VAKARKNTPKKAAIGRPTVPARGTWLPWLMAIGIAAAALLVYIPAYDGEWAWDDDISVYSNPQVTQPGGLGRIWLTTEDHDFWPLTRTAFRAEYAVFKDAPAGYHAVNIVLHAVASVLVFLVLRRLGVPCAVLGGLAFAVHPVNAAAVVWISELKTLLAMIFLALTVLAWLRFERDRRWTWYAAAWLAYAAALASKTSVVTWPVMMLGLAWWHRGRITWRDLAESAPFFAVAGAMSAMTLLVQARMVNVLTRPLVGLAKVAGVGWVFWFYVQKALVPAGLSAIYPHWKDTIVSLGWTAYLPTAALATLLIVSWLKRGTVWGRSLLLAAGYCLLAMFPVLGLFSSTITMHSLVADHYEYLPIVGVIALACASGWALVQRRPRAQIAGGVVAAAILILLASATVTRAGVWSSGARLWRDTLDRNPQSWVAHYNVATDLTMRSRRMVSDVLEESRTSDALLQQAQALEARGDSREAASYREASGSGRRGTEAKVLEIQVLCREAVSHYRRSIEIQPLHIRSYANLGLVLVSLGQADEALGVYRRGIELEDRYYGEKKDPTLWFNFSQALLGRQRFAEAIPACRTALRLAPGDQAAVANLAQALSGLAWVRSTSRDPAARSTEEALSCVSEALRLVPNPGPTLQDVHAAVLADAGRFAEAVTVASGALRSAREQQDDRLAAALAGRVELYAAGKPYRDPR